MSRVEVGVDMPSHGDRVWYYPGPTNGAVGQFGPLLRIQNKESESWFASCRAGIGTENSTFEFGPQGSSFISIVNGAGYHIHCDDRDKWSELPLSPQIRTAKHLPDMNTVLLFDWFSAAAYGPEGERWHTDRLFLDDLELIEADRDTIHMRGGVLGGNEEITLRTSDGFIQSGRAFDWGNYARR